ncbi:M3 family metallopeptidase [Rubellimicrobium sp. CFH 75288]|uniref:M3 family metallopeptidase n=1 Tax=Rubellimicrobium sp. CFH 75288 TaxID=2697034 RepID=UPI0014132BF6|nr:M3 family metallopeptidase [Rubellimicrobium sp. CFH 75288]NAZ36601.1 peptidase M3 [Rubellimicrobium sp. CFH 75288]
MNPLLDEWTTPFGLPPWDSIRDEHWAEAVGAALEEARAAVAAIAADPEPPTFANTVVALEGADRRLRRILGAFRAVAGAASNPERQAVERDLAPKLAEFASDVTGNRALFARIEALWEGREGLGLSPEEARVLRLTHRGFVRAGARLEGEAAARMRAIRSRLAVLGTLFAQNVLADERDWALMLEEADLEGLPDVVVAALRAAGQARGLGGPAVTLSRSVVVPFLQLSPRRDLRRRAFEAWTSRGRWGGTTDNRAIAAETLALRAERARLLGFGDFASWKLETEMAGEAGAVRGLLEAVWGPARAAAERDRAALEALMAEDGVEGPLEPWDWAFYAERLRRQRHALDEAEVKPFLRLGRMRDAAFAVAGRLWDLEFRPAEDAPRWHDEVETWEVVRGGRPVGVLQADWFAREGKRSGAWCMSLRPQGRLGGAEERPQVAIVCNFARGSGGGEALLSWDDARTLFHEFGHALHALLSDVTFPSVAGTAVARDFVELPSQLLEHWLEVPELLAEWATDDEGRPMPEALRDRLLAARGFDAGFRTVEYLASAFVDLAFHEGDPPADSVQREAEVLEALGMPRAIRPRHAAPHFGHVFAGDGYAAGYYSYLWAEVMDADAFAAFEEAEGPWDRAVAARLEREILSVGGARDERESWLAFRGRMPGVEALLRGRGLLGETEPGVVPA